MKRNYFKLLSFFVATLLLSNTALAQITYNESFTTGVNGWSTNWSGTTTQSCDGNSVRRNIWTTGTAGAFLSPNLGNHGGAAMAISFDYKIVDSSAATAPTAATFGTIAVQWSTSAAGPWTTVHTINSSNHIPAATCANVVVPEFCAAAGDFYMRFNCIYGTGDYYIYFDNVDVVPGTPQCAAPANLVATTFDNVSATFDWGSGCGETGWNFEFGAENFIPGTGDEIYASTVTSPTETVTGLTQITTYDAYVQADCGSAWLGPVTITSLPNCSAPTGLTSTVISPDSTSLTWTAGSTGETEWTIAYGPSPFMPGDSNATFVSVLTDPNDTITGLMQNTTYDFYVLGNCSATDSSLWVGPETITTPLFCNNVSGLSATTVTDTAFLSWTAGSNAETMWNVEYGPVGFELGTGTMYSTMNNNTDTLVGLLGSASYDFYVQAACASGDTSLFTGAGTFTMPLTNDEACDAIELAVDSTTWSFSSVGSTDAGVLTGENSSTWFYFVHPNSNGVFASLCGSSFDTKLYGYTRTDCADYTTFTQIAYNDDDCGLSSAFEVCGAPGDTIFLMVTGFGATTVGEFNINVSEINLGAGTDGAATVCALDSVDLNSVATVADPSGTWSFDLNPNTIVNDSLFNASSVPVGTHIATYYVVAGCAMDSAVATLTVVAPGQTGTAVSPFTMCNADNVFLPDGLTGSVEAGGTWSDDSGTGLLAGPNGNVFVANGLPVGTYPFTYTVDNGVCPAASTTVTVTLTTCTEVVENNVEFTIYPNPNNGIFNVTSNISEVVEITVMDVQGNVVYNSKLNITGGTPEVITLDNVETGMYILKVAAQSNVSTSSFVVK